MARESSSGTHGLARLNQLRRRIERWQWTRTKRSPMPPELWTAAAELARELGAYRGARTVGVSTAARRRRTGRRSCAPWLTRARRTRSIRFAHLRDVIDRVSTHPASRVEELTPRVWKELHQ